MLKLILSRTSTRIQPSSEITIMAITVQEVVIAEEVVDGEAEVAITAHGVILVVSSKPTMDKLHSPLKISARWPEPSSRT